MGEASTLLKEAFPEKFYLLYLLFIKIYNMYGLLS